eukprot:scaffold1854_cov42-Phaeocystis_antarctica.AAC.1
MSSSSRRRLRYSCSIRSALVLTLFFFSTYSTHSTHSTYSTYYTYDGYPYSTYYDPRAPQGGPHPRGSGGGAARLRDGGWTAHQG